VYVYQHLFVHYCVLTVLTILDMIGRVSSGTLSIYSLTFILNQTSVISRLFGTKLLKIVVDINTIVSLLKIHTKVVVMQLVDVHSVKCGL